MSITHGNLNPGVIREELLNLLEDDYPEGSFDWKLDLHWLWGHYVGYYLFIILMHKECELYHPHDLIETEGDDYYVVTQMCNTDLSQIPLMVAAIAWLTVDDWRWDLEKHPEIPDGLSYGLVTLYPRPITRGCAFLAGLTEEEFSVEDYEDAQVYALQTIKEEHFPEYSEEEIVKQVLG
jgi:hypothetical protein